jgi:pyrrolidone-carboxylate peptidase
LCDWIQAIHIENSVYNQCDFLIPDDNGKQPIEEKINPNLNFEDLLTTSFDVQSIVNKLGNDFALAKDPGRYFCNYAYYKAFENVQANQTNSALFVHFPTFKTFPREKLVSLILKLTGLLFE